MRIQQKVLLEILKSNRDRAIQDQKLVNSMKRELMIAEFQGIIESEVKFNSQTYAPEEGWFGNTVRYHSKYRRDVFDDKTMPDYQWYIDFYTHHTPLPEDLGCVEVIDEVFSKYIRYTDPFGLENMKKEYNKVFGRDHMIGEKP